MAASATFALKAGVWFRRGRLFIVSPDSRDTACPLSGRNSTYRPVQILEAGSKDQTVGTYDERSSERLSELLGQVPVQWCGAHDPCTAYSARDSPVSIGSRATRRADW